MKDQHTKISGYRDLTQDEIDLMNEAKALEAKCLAFHARVETQLEAQKLSSEGGDAYRLQQADAFRWHAIARTDIETGFMALVRSIAQPQPYGDHDND